jgi:hypothetical protein
MILFSLFSLFLNVRQRRKTERYDKDNPGAAGSRQAEEFAGRNAKDAG